MGDKITTCIQSIFDDKGKRVGGVIFIGGKEIVSGGNGFIEEFCKTMKTEYQRWKKHPKL